MTDPAAHQGSEPQHWMVQLERRAPDGQNFWRIFREDGLEMGHRESDVLALCAALNALPADSERREARPVADRHRERARQIAVKCQHITTGPYVACVPCIAAALADAEAGAHAETNALTKPPLGTWAGDDVRRWFVDGASWWEFTKTGCTMWPSDRDRAEAEAESRLAGSKAPKEAT